jgi:hypothetical protein
VVDLDAPRLLVENRLPVDGRDVSQQARERGILNADLLDDVRGHGIPFRLGNDIALEDIAHDPAASVPRSGRIVDLAEDDGASEGVGSHHRARLRIACIRRVQQLRKVTLLEVKGGHRTQTRDRLRIDVIPFQVHEEEGLIAAVVDLRDPHRACHGEAVVLIAELSLLAA